MLLNYTDPITVRALLGVSDLEIEDSQLSLPLYLLAIESGIDKLNENVLPMYLTLAGVTSKSLLQTRFYNSVRLYAGTLVALELLPTLPMAAPKRIMDEKASVERVNDPYALLVANMKATLDALGARILASMAILDPTKAVTRVQRTFAVSVGLAIDPVTGR